jgi:beta-galactosidase
MAEIGLTWVRIGEFSWSRLEPTPGELDFSWLDAAIETLGQAGLKVVLGTPTATPPRWMLNRHPDMLAVDAQGRPRKFGSRRHYCFSHLGYKAECERIVRLLAERYGDNPHVAAWQTDNEYGCHDTTISYSDAARQAFRVWLAQRYENIHDLNRDWGNVFWSMEYSDFDEIDLPNLTVTEPNPAHSLAFRRFSSDQVVVFNRLQTDLIRQFSKAPVAHNYMGRITDFDHYKVGDDLEIASWDSYPLGFLEDRVGADAARQRRYAQQGDPDFQAFHHDLYRAVGNGRWWVMEQQPGPVNWAPYNPAPLPGMVRLWSWEAFAHGAEAVCYFRWRQAPMAQEQMHAGMLRPDSVAAPAAIEAQQVAQDLSDAPEVKMGRAQVGLIFDYDADAAWTVQPHGAGQSYFGLVFECYRALRKLGLSVDVLRPQTRDFSGYALVLAPGLMHMPDDLKAALAAHAGVPGEGAEGRAQVLVGPRSAARTEDMVIPTPLPPALPGLDVTVSRVESLRPDLPRSLSEDSIGQISGYQEHLEGRAAVTLRDAAGAAVVMGEGGLSYLGAMLDRAGWITLCQRLCKRAGLETVQMPSGLRRRACGGERFWFNHLPQETMFEGRSFAALSVTRDVL